MFAAASLRRMADAIVAVLRRRDSSVDEAYLAQSVDMADLEIRLKHLSESTVSNALVRLRAMAWARS
jgi:hypothetical protein